MQTQYLPLIVFFTSFSLSLFTYLLPYSRKLDLYLYILFIMSSPTIALQWDVGASVFATGSALANLIIAATQEDVQTQAVVAAEAIGNVMKVEPHLIGQAVATLNQGENYKINKIKLHLGLSNGGISRQLVQSPGALRIFLLISACRLVGMDSRDIGDMLFEMLVIIYGENVPLVSPDQLTRFAKSVEGHCLKIREWPSDPLKYISILSEHASQHSTQLGGMFSPLTPNKGADLFVAVFRAIREDEISQLEIKGAQSAFWIVCILCWLFPQAVRVVGLDGKELISCQTDTPTVSLVLNPNTSDSEWILEQWHKLSDLSTIIVVKDNPTYEQNFYPKFIAQDSIFTLCLQALGAPMKGRNDVLIVGMLAHAFIRAAYEVGIVKKAEVSRPTHQSVRFSDICSQNFHSMVVAGLTKLGWPENHINIDQGHKIAEYIVKHRNMLRTKCWVDVANGIDKTIALGRLGFSERAAEEISLIMQYSMSIADTLLLYATIDNQAEVRVDQIIRHKFGEPEPILFALLGIESCRLNALDYLSLVYRSMLPADSLSSFKLGIPPLAISFRGQVAACRGLFLHQFEAPESVAEAFQIVLQPGLITWKGSRQLFLLEAEELQPSVSVAPRNSLFHLGGDISSVSMHTRQLRITQFKDLEFSVKKGLRPQCIHLRCTGASTGDGLSQLWPALINWSLALRIQPSHKDIIEQQAICVNNGVVNLQLKAPGNDSSAYDSISLSQSRAVAVYSCHRWCDLLRFGSAEMNDLSIIIQGAATIFDCVIEATKAYNNGWIIMANS
jgi:hypothetical protein